MRKLIAVSAVSLLVLSGCGTSQTAAGDPGAIFAGAAIGGNVGGAIGGLIGQLSEPLPEQPSGMLCLPPNKRHTVTG